MPHRCPWYLGYVLINPLRRLMQPPKAILEPWVKAGDVVFEPGPGMGYFTLDLARLVGPAGRVVVADVEPRMLASLVRRVRRAGLADRVEARLAGETSLGIDDLAASVDFVLAFAVVHELPDASGFFQAVARAMKPGARLLFAEPAGHVSESAFAEELALAAAAGLTIVDRPTVRSSLAAVLARSA